MTNNFNMLNGKVDLLRVIRQFQHETFARLNCMRIGTIDKVISPTEVQCSITNKQYIKTNNDGSTVWQSYPPILAKVWYMGNIQSNITYPIQIKSPCLLLFNDREFTSYFATGEVSPLNDNRMHSLDDCICIPLFMPQQINGFTINGETVNINGSTINMTANNINLNGTVNVNGQLIINGQNFTAHVHSNGNQGANTGGVVV